MNRKRKLNDLYKGVFKNDKKSCLVDLKPLDKKREIEKKINMEESDENMNIMNNQMNHVNNKLNPKTKSKAMNVSLKVDKHLRFGTFFKRAREDIVDVFLAKDDYISYEGLISSTQINDLFTNSFTGRDSNNNNEMLIEGENNNNNNINNNISKKNLSVTQMMNIGDSYNINNITTTLVKPNNNINPIEEEAEEILYEDEMETIYKRKKPMSRNFNNVNNLMSTNKDLFDISNIVNLTKGRPNTSTVNNMSSSSHNNNIFSNNPFMPINYEERYYFNKRRNFFMEVDNDESLNMNLLNNVSGNSKRQEMP